MNPKRFITLALCLVFCAQAIAQDQSMDKELSDLAQNLAGQIKERGRKKVAVLDFTDLQGGATELGRYAAEQLTVDLVLLKRDFAVLDRANLKSILDEHKLTASGLVNPDNAKKLGEFSGVDALILGTIVPRDKDIELTAKVITTDTAEIVGAARVSFTKSSDAQKMLQSTVAPGSGGIGSLSAPSTDFDANKSSFDFGPLNVTLDSFRVLQNGQIAALLLFKNTDTNNAIRVAFNHDASGNPAATLLDDLNLEYQAVNVSGVTVRRRSGYWYSPTATQGQLQDQMLQGTQREMAGATPIEPGSTTTATVTFLPQSQNGGQIGSSFRMQAMLTVASKASYYRETFSQYTLLIDGIRSRQARAQ